MYMYIRKSKCPSILYFFLTELSTHVYKHESFHALESSDKRLTYFHDVKL